MFTSSTSQLYFTLIIFDFSDFPGDFPGHICIMSRAFL